MNESMIREAMEAVSKNPELLKFVPTDTLNDVSEELWNQYCERIEHEYEQDNYAMAQLAYEEAMEEAYGAINGFK